MNIMPSIRWEADHPTHLETVKRDLENAVSDLHTQRLALEMSSAVVPMLEKRVAWLKQELELAQN